MSGGAENSNTLGPERLVLETLNDVASILNKGIIRPAGKGLISIQARGFEAIVNPRTNIIVTFSPL